MENYSLFYYNSVCKIFLQNNSELAAGRGAVIFLLISFGVCFGRLHGNIFLQRSFKIKTGAGEGAAYAHFFKQLQCMQVDFLHNVEVFEVLACFGVANNTYIKAAAVIGEEMNAYIIFINKREILQIIFQLEDKFLDLGSRCTVGQAKRKVDAATFAQSIVGNRRVAEEGVRNINKLLRKGADTGAAEGNAFYDTFDAVGFNPVADFKGLVEQDNHTAENIGQRILGCKCNSQRADTEGGDEGADVIIPFAGYGYKAQHDDNHTENSRENVGDGFIGLDAESFQQIEENAVRCINQVIQAPEKVGDNDRAQNAVSKAEIVY